MSFDDLIRRFFGFPPNYDRFFDPNDRVPGFRNPIWEDEENDDEDELQNFARGDPRGHPFGFNVFTGDPFQMNVYFERELNDLMRSFQDVFQSPIGDHLLQLPASNFSEPLDQQQAVTPRDRYLKPSFKKPTGKPKGDIDIDSRVTSDNLGKILDGNEWTEVETPRPQFFGQSVVSKSIRGPDGRVEHRKMFTRSDGTKEETITRQLGDQTYSVTTKTQADGTTEKNEEFINMDEDNLNDFERKWNRNGHGHPAALQPRFENKNHAVSSEFENNGGGNWFTKMLGKWFS